MSFNNITNLNQDDFKGLQIYNNSRQLSTLFTDYSNVVLLPSISLFGIVTNLISIKVALKLNKNQLMNLYILFDSILNLLLSLITVFLGITRCGSLCPFGYKYISKLYDLYLYLYIKHSILFLSHALKSLIALNRLCAFSAKSCCFKIDIRNFKILSVVLLILALLMQAFLFLYIRYINKFGVLIYKNENDSSFDYEFLYKIDQKIFSSTPRLIVLAMLLLEDLFLTIVLFFIDALILIKFHFYSKNKQNKFSNTGIIVFRHS
jgi:hypothetical protein